MYTHSKSAKFYVKLIQSAIILLGSSPCFEMLFHILHFEPNDFETILLANDRKWADSVRWWSTKKLLVAKHATEKSVDSI